MNVPREPEQKGILEWDVKLKLCKALLDCQSNDDLAKKVLKDKNWGHDDIAKVTENIGRWKLHQPTGTDSRNFINYLANKLPAKPDLVITGHMLLTRTTQDLVGLLANDSQTNVILESLGLAFGREQTTRRPLSAASPRDTYDPDVYKIYHYETGKLETIEAAVGTGLVDQKHYYLDPSSADAWSELVGAGGYPTYTHCKAGLEKLVGSPEWKQQIQANRPATVVMLAGGGAPDKDMVFIRELVDATSTSDRINLHLLDASPYMIANSMRTIRRHLRQFAIEKNVRWYGHWCDVLNIPLSLNNWLHKTGNVKSNVVFAITGGTLGNFSEKAFFRSLERIAHPGDLLVVSVETVDDLTPEEESGLLAKYDNDDLRRWLRPVVRSVLHEASSSLHLQHALAKIEVKLTESDVETFSDVSSSRTVTVVLPLEDRSVTLLTSTRYLSSALVRFAKLRKWDAVCQVASPNNPRYKQFLFRRK